jgi:hypothetical protein
MNVTQGNSLPGSATSSATISLVCCTPADTPAYAVRGDDPKTCLYCGSSSSLVNVVWIHGPLSSPGQMQAGAISQAVCSGQLGAVGTIQSTCPQGVNGTLMTVTITYAAGTIASTVKMIRSCPASPSNIVNRAVCPFSYGPIQGGLIVTATGSSTKYQFSFQLTSMDPNCRCGSVYWAVKQTGMYATSGSSTCSQLNGRNVIQTRPRRKNVRGSL